MSERRSGDKAQRPTEREPAGTKQRRNLFQQLARRRELAEFLFRSPRQLRKTSGVNVFEVRFHHLGRRREEQPAQNGEERFGAKIRVVTQQVPAIASVTGPQIGGGIELRPKLTQEV